MDIKKALRIDDSSRIGTTASSPFIGSPGFDEVPFQVHSGVTPALNSFVVVERDGTDVLHYGRITTGREENPRADPALLQKNSAYQIGQKDPRQSDKSPHVTRTMVVEVLGEVHLEDGELAVREPSMLAQTGKAVYEFPPEQMSWLLNLPKRREDGIHLGSVASGAKTVDIFLPDEMIPRQTTICGRTGTGKSYAAGVLAEELVAHGIPVISFDILGDLIKATDELGGRNFRAGVDFRVPYATIGLSEFLAFVNLTSQQRELVEMAYETLADEAHNTLDKTGKVTMPYERLYDEIRSVGASTGQAAVAERAVQRVKSAFNRNELLTEKTEEWLVELTRKPMLNVFIGHLSQNKRSLVVGAAVRMLQTLRRRDRVPPFALIIDEAHLLLPSGNEHTASTAVLREMVRTARHHSVGVILITQSPSSMDKGALLACNTRIVFALDRDDLRLLSGTMGDLSDEAIARIPKLPKGTAIITASPEIMRHSAQVRIRRRKTTAGAPTPNMREEVQKWRSRRSTKA
ncbi:MAG TPA: ATP-binding protein [Pyrinomonadaceae bacterium]|jgi:hypothetical protein